MAAPTVPPRTPLSNGDRWFAECTPGKLERVFHLSPTDESDSSAALVRRVRRTTGDVVIIPADRALLCAKAERPGPGRQAALPEVSGPTGRTRARHLGLGFTPAARPRFVRAEAPAERRRLEFTPATDEAEDLQDPPPTPFALVYNELAEGVEIPPVAELPDEMPDAMVPGDALAQLRYGNQHGEISRRDVQDRAQLLWFAAAYRATMEELRAFQVWWAVQAAALLDDSTRLEGIPRMLYHHSQLLLREEMDAYLGITPPAPESREDRARREVEAVRAAGEAARSRHTHNEIPPPAQLVDEVEEGEAFSLPFRARPSGGYPPCFSTYNPKDRADVTAAQMAWDETVRELVRKYKPTARHLIKDPGNMYEGMIQHGWNLLQASGFYPKLLLNDLGRSQVELTVPKGSRNVELDTSAGLHCRGLRIPLTPTGVFTLDQQYPRANIQRCKGSIRQRPRSAHIPRRGLPAARCWSLDVDDVLVTWAGLGSAWSRSRGRGRAGPARPDQPADPGRLSEPPAAAWPPVRGRLTACRRPPGRLPAATWPPRTNVPH